MTASWAANFILFFGVFMILVYAATVVWEMMLAEIPEDEPELPKLKVIRLMRKQSRYGA